MHTRGKVHRDVKPGNIVIVGGDNEATPLTAKVADFGMACGEKRQISSLHRTGWHGQCGLIFLLYSRR